MIAQLRHPRHDRLRPVLTQRRRFGDSRRRAHPPSHRRRRSPRSPPRSAEMPTVPTLHIDIGTLAALATSSCVAVFGCNTVLVTVTLHGSSSSPSSSALTVFYSKRSHAAGRTPSTPSRRDNQQLGESATLGLGSCSLTTATAPRPLPRRPLSLRRERRPRGPARSPTRSVKCCWRVGRGASGSRSSRTRGGRGGGGGGDDSRDERSDSLERDASDEPC